MEKLKEIIEITGVGIPSLQAIQLKRVGDKALYKRADGPYEVIKIQVREEEEIFGKKYPTREVYPGNEDFGVTAWCYSEYQNALDKFEKV